MRSTEFFNILSSNSVRCLSAPCCRDALSTNLLTYELQHRSIVSEDSNSRPRNSKWKTRSQRQELSSRALQQTHGQEDGNSPRTPTVSAFKVARPSNIFATQGRKWENLSLQRWAILARSGQSSIWLEGAKKMHHASWNSKRQIPASGEGWWRERGFRITSSRNEELTTTVINWLSNIIGANWISKRGLDGGKSCLHFCSKTKGPIFK